MKPEFRINRIPPQDRSDPFDVFITDQVLNSIASLLLQRQDLKPDGYDVKWIEERNYGRYIVFETDSSINYISISPHGSVGGRNSSVQSVSTAYKYYLKEKCIGNKETHFYYYFLNHEGNLATDYLLFCYRLMRTMGVVFLNPQECNGLEEIRRFSDVKDVIAARNLCSASNNANQSTYITDEGNEYHIYGKTFGANAKETALLCYAISELAEKPVTLFQIMDNDTDSIGETDKDSIKLYVKINNLKEFTIVDDTYEFEENRFRQNIDNLRSPKFKYNLLVKYGAKKCALCDCKIESIIQGAHIYPVTTIRHLEIDFSKKLKMAIEGNNGIWLCENHHKLFDDNIIHFVEGSVEINNDYLTEEDYEFVDNTTKNKSIKEEYLNDRMLSYFDLRDGLKPRLDVVNN